MQFDLDLPQGLSLKVVDGDYDIDIAGRTTWKNHSLSANATDGIIRFLLASSSNKALSGTEGAIIKMTLVADESYKGEGIALKNILLVTPEEKETKPEDIVPVGIRDIAADTKQRHTSVYRYRTTTCHTAKGHQYPQWKENRSKVIVNKEIRP